MKTYQALLDRRSIRKYENIQIEEAVLKEIVRAGMCAPSAMNSQPWEFIIVTDKALLYKLSQVSSSWAPLLSAQAAIITLSDIRGYKGSITEYFSLDCAAATQNMLIAAQGNGLGGVWLGAYLKQDRCEPLRKILNIPKHIIIFSIIALGYPAEIKPPHTDFIEEKIHFNIY